ncbi:MAG: monovalent cation/H+ antiporter subunit D family protein [Alphaproteobacteria bacterium]
MIAEWLAMPALAPVVTQLPALQVVIPLLAAPLIIVVGHARLAWALALLAALAAFACAIGLLFLVLANGPISYALGGWAPPWGIEYRVDLINAFMLLIVAGSGAIILVYAPRSVDSEIARPRQTMFYALFTLCLTGLLGILITGDAFNVFVFLEISSLSMYALIALGRDRRALTAAFRYLVMGTIGATFYLIGVGLMYIMTGTLNLADLAERLPMVTDPRPVYAAFGFLIVGLALKAALFPLHLWLPNAYAYAPSVVSAFVAATATKVSVYLIMRVIFTVFGREEVFGDLAIGYGLLLPAAVAIVLASLSAIFEQNVKRLLAYSSVAQIGYIVTGLTLATTTGLTAAILHLFNHALMKGALFCALGAIVYRVGSARLTSLAGLGWQMPYTSAAFVLTGLSLIGVPLTGGFVSKWYLVQAAIEYQMWWLVATILIGSLLSVVYVWRVVEVLYLQEPPAGRPPVQEAPLSLLLPTAVLALANVYFGVETSMPLTVASRGALSLLGLGE